MGFLGTSPPLIKSKSNGFSFLNNKKRCDYKAEQNLVIFTKYVLITSFDSLNPPTRCFPGAFNRYFQYQEAVLVESSSSISSSTSSAQWYLQNGYYAAASCHPQFRVLHSLATQLCHVHLSGGIVLCKSVTDSIASPRFARSSPHLF
jgi:hypothetical protein